MGVSTKAHARGGHPVRPPRHQGGCRRWTATARAQNGSPRSCGSRRSRPGSPGAVLTLVVWRSLDPRDGLLNLFSGLSGIRYATLGAVIVRRARNPIGWILQGIALGLALLSFSGAYGVAGLVWRPGSFPGAVGRRRLRRDCGR